VQQICRDNPEAYFGLAPYAMALGCDRVFARRFGKTPMPICPYIQIGKVGSLTASQWNQLMHHVLTVMTLRQRKMPLERIKTILGKTLR